MSGYRDTNVGMGMVRYYDSPADKENERLRRELGAMAARCDNLLGVLQYVNASVPAPDEEQGDDDLISVSVGWVRRIRTAIFKARER